MLFFISERNLVGSRAGESLLFFISHVISAVHFFEKKILFELKNDQTSEKVRCPRGFSQRFFPLKFEVPEFWNIF